MSSHQIQLIYAPYNFFKWAKKQTIVPENSFLVCGIPVQSEMIASEQYYFVINHDLDDGQQMAQILAMTGAYWCQTQNKCLQDGIAQLLGLYTTDWVLQQATISTPSQNDSRLLVLSNDIIHPITTCLEASISLGVLNPDILCYIGTTNANTSDFFCNGQNTEIQLDNFLSYLKSVMAKSAFDNLIKETQKSWHEKQRTHGQQYGFMLSDYNFSEHGL